MEVADEQNFFTGNFSIVLHKFKVEYVKDANQRQSLDMFDLPEVVKTHTLPCTECLVDLFINLNLFSNRYLFKTLGCIK